MASLSEDPVSRSKKMRETLYFMVVSRIVDEIEQEYTARGEAFFHVSGAGHEAIAMLSPYLIKEDYLHSHYRDKALLLSHGMASYEYFIALFNKNDGHSHGRQMNAHMSARAFNVLSLAGPVGNSAPQAAGVAQQLKYNYKQHSSSRMAHGTPLVMCAQGEGTTHQGEFLEGLLLSVIDSLPMLWIIEDNQFAISTNTKGRTFYQTNDGSIDNFSGCPITRVDGRQPHQVYDIFSDVVHKVRTQCKPQIVVLSTERLASHTNADDHRVYRSEEDRDQLERTGDPIINLIMHLDTCNYDDAKIRFEHLSKDIRVTLQEEASKAQRSAEPKAVFTAKKPLANIVQEKAAECQAEYKNGYETGDKAMLEAMREVLHEKLSTDKRAFLYGQDIEDPKGDVFGLTKGLSTEFSGRVLNSPLSESLIVGTCIGRALAGARPIAFLQFADFFPLAFNQIISDLATMYWRTAGSWEAPVLVLATCGGYRPGLGPFHASVMESISAHIPGLDVHMPSNAADAAGLLNGSFLSERPTIFFYPKNQLNTKVETISAKGARKYVIVPGKARVVEEGKDISFVGYGNTISLCVKAAAALKEFGITSDIIDIRSMSPLDDYTIGESVKKTGLMLVTHEDNGTASMSSEIMARVIEKYGAHNIRIKRVVKRDAFVPCNFENQLDILPSYKTILETAVKMLGGTITWKKLEKIEEGFVDIMALGTSPSDEQLNIIKWFISKGDVIKKGDLIAEGEAEKAVCDIKASVDGEVDSFFAEEGDVVDIGKPIVRIKTSGDKDRVYTVTKEEAGIPQITISKTNTTLTRPASGVEVSVSHVETVLGSRIVDNKEIVKISPEWTEEKIVNSTGIKSRHWVSENQDIVSMAYEAAVKTLKSAKLSIFDISGIICTTGTHRYQTPSLAAMLQYHLVNKADVYNARVAASQYQGYAFDISAACSGFLFGVNDCYNRVLLNKNEKILLVTAEVLSDRIDMTDYGTAPVFSDAASAMIISVADTDNAARSDYGIISSQPLLKTVGEPAKDLVVPEQGSIRMNGVEVYKVAVENLTQVAQQVCAVNKVSLNDIDLIVPHQANAKIIRGVARRLKIPVEKFYINIDTHGNSSSNTVPICLYELAQNNILKGKKILIVVFGGGYTFAGALLQY